PIGLLGGINIHNYAPNPVERMDPFGLTKKSSATKSAACKQCDDNPCGNLGSAKAARRKAMRQTGVPVASQPKASRNVLNWEQYLYEVKVPSNGGRTTTIVVSHHPADKDHECPHWHAAPAKLDDNGEVISRQNGLWKYEAGGPVVQHKG
ncbi:hypothetical protein, partial [Aquitalea sp. FJL05]